MLVLGIESTCDETAAAVVENGKKILSSVIASQVEIHAKYGGVFPELASRHHIHAIIPVIDKALLMANIRPPELDLIAVARGPGLIGSLLIGVHAAKALSLAWKKPFIGLNHVEAHLYAAMMDPFHEEKFPSLGVVLSGGHTLLLKILDVGQYEVLGGTQDDAVGEAFDKVASLLGLPYPGGPALELLAKSGDPFRFPFKAGQIKNFPLDFSLSGLKTKVLYTLKGNGAKKDSPLLIGEHEKKDVAASFQRVVFEDVIKKILLAAQQEPYHAIYFGGGVSNNEQLREMCTQKLCLPIYFPSKGLSLDNAAMIAGLGFEKFRRKPLGDPLDLDTESRLSL